MGLMLQHFDQSSSASSDDKLHLTLGAFHTHQKLHPMPLNRSWKLFGNKDNFLGLFSNVLTLILL